MGYFIPRDSNRDAAVSFMFQKEASAVEKKERAVSVLKAVDTAMHRPRSKGDYFIPYFMMLTLLEIEVFGRLPTL